MTVHFTSDCHWHHKRICQYAGRPFNSVEEMNEEMIRRWNSVVAQDDIVYHLGDWAFATIDQVKTILRRLNGTKNFINGNHDKVIKENAVKLLKSGLINSIKDYDEINVNGQFIVLCHYPMREFNRCHRGSWALFGHVHNNLPPHGKSVDVGVDSTWVTGKAEYRPFSFQELERFMRKQPIIQHHGD